MGLVGRKVLVTGASAGVGAAIARDLAARGARIALLARRAEVLDEVAREIDAVAIAADLRVPADVGEAVRSAQTALGGLDALVNNAGVFRLGHVADGLYSDWRDMLDTNVLGLLTAVQAAAPYLADSPQGQIVNISSMSGHRVSHPATGVYAASKHAVHAASEAIRAEFHPKGIRVTVVSPGTVRTNEGAYITDLDLRAEARKDQLEFGLAPEEVADAVAYALSAPRGVHLLEIAMMSSRQYPA